MKHLATGLAVVLALGASAAAFAATTSVSDRDDVTSALDIAKASGGHNRVTDQLVHTVDFYGPVSAAALVNKGRPPSSVCVEIWTRSTPGESAPDYEACAGPKAKGKGWVGSIARKRLLGPQLRLGAVKVEQPTPTRIVMRIDPDDIKRPPSYRWRTDSTSFAADCKSSSGCSDFAPDRPATAQTRLSTPRS
jgi:hypothetical protein